MVVVIDTSLLVRLVGSDEDFFILGISLTKMKQNKGRNLFGVYEIHIMNDKRKTYWNFKFKAKMAFLKGEKFT